MIDTMPFGSISREDAVFTRVRKGSRAVLSIHTSALRKTSASVGRPPMVTLSRISRASLIAAFRALFHARGAAVRVRTFEVRDARGALVAGELGYAVGDVYTKEPSGHGYASPANGTALSLKAGTDMDCGDWGAHAYVNDR